jgi:hypothetical protein
VYLKTNINIGFVSKERKRKDSEGEENMGEIFRFSCLEQKQKGKKKSRRDPSKKAFHAYI